MRNLSKPTTQDYVDNAKTGTVDWFNNTSGEGMVRDSKTGQWYYVHYSAIYGQEHRHWKTLDPGANVTFFLSRDPSRGQVRWVAQHKDL